MKTLLGLALLISMVLAGCATGTYHPYPTVAHVPSGPGTVPPEWYDNDPTLRQWYDPWFHTPYY